MSDEPQRPRILLVDDEEQHRHIASYVLRSDYEVVTAGSCAEALRQAEARTLDLALVDYRMPGEEGTVFLARLRVLQPRCLRFLVTAYSDEGVLRQAINDGGVYRFVSKPVNYANLEMDIRRALEHRGAEEQAQRGEKLAMAGTLASIAVHDLRNAVQGLMLVPMLIDGGSAEDLARAKDTLEWAQRTMLSCISEVLAVAKGDTPTYDLQLGPLRGIVDNVVAVQAKLHADRHFSIELPADLPPVRRSERHVQRMLANLVSNAAQAVPPGGHVTVRGRVDAAGLQVEVVDDGPGIPAEVRGRLFEPMFTTKGSGGVGLGLRMCRTVMGAHHGTLGFDSAMGEGTTFRATFPLEPPGA